MNLVKEFWLFLRSHLVWWLAPTIILIVVICLLLMFANGPALSPFLYGR